MADEPGRWAEPAVSTADLWRTLGIAPTRDEREIKRAYAAQLKLTRPDENPAGFQHLRACRDQALAIARDAEPLADENEDEDCADVEAADESTTADDDAWMIDASGDLTLPRWRPLSADTGAQAAVVERFSAADINQAVQELLTTLIAKPDALTLARALDAHPVFDRLDLRDQLEQALIAQMLDCAPEDADALCLLAERFELESIVTRRRHPHLLLQQLDRLLVLARAHQAIRTARQSSWFARGSEALKHRSWRLLAGDFGRIGLWLALAIPGQTESARAVLRELNQALRQVPTTMLHDGAVEFVELLGQPLHPLVWAGVRITVAIVGWALFVVALIAMIQVLQQPAPNAALFAPGRAEWVLVLALFGAVSIRWIVPITLLVARQWALIERARQRPAGHQMLCMAAAAGYFSYPSFGALFLFVLTALPQIPLGIALSWGTIAVLRASDSQSLASSTGWAALVALWVAVLMAAFVPRLWLWALIAGVALGEPLSAAIAHGFGFRLTYPALAAVSATALLAFCTQILVQRGFARRSAAQQDWLAAGLSSGLLIGIWLHWLR